MWLYRGEIDKYTNLLNGYRTKLGSEGSFSDIVDMYTRKLKDLKKEVKKADDAVTITLKKEIREKYEVELAEVTELLTIAKEANWLHEKFGDGVYVDVLGLCKVATISEIEDKDWSLNPGTYVGVAPIYDDGVNFEERMEEIHRELLLLQEESNELMDTILKNMEEMGI